MRIKNAMWALALGVFITACENDDNGGEEPMPTGDYANGIMVSNEGPFNNGTGTVSFISNDLTMKEDNIFNTVNNEDLGNIVQSIGFVEDKAYVIANVSNKITVVDRFTFVKEAEITAGLNNPRYFVAVNGKGYVTNWGDTADDTDDYIAIIDLQTNSVEGSIPVVLGPEEIVVKEDKIYVAHQGAFGQNDKVSVIDSNTNEVTIVITVGDVPNSMQFDSDGNLWVLCGGKPAFTGEETGGSLIKIDTDSDTTLGSLNFETTQHPNHLSEDGSAFYYSLGGAVFSISDSATTIPMTSDFSELSIYAMTTLDGKLYLTDAKNFASNGTLTIYDLGSKSELASFEVGIIPGGIYFN